MSTTITAPAEQQQWHVHLTCTLTTPITHDDTFELIEQLEDVHAALALHTAGDRLEVELTISAADAQSALEAAQQRIRQEEGIQIDAVTSLEVRTEQDRLEREQNPTIPPLLDLAGVGEKAGVSRQRASVLSRREDFPEPTLRTARGPLYAEAAIEAWLASWSRKPGRPRRNVTAAA